MSLHDPARRPRLDDVAAAAGVSPSTVSLVLRGIAGPSAATQQRVTAAAVQLGYRPDRAASVLASRRSRLIGVMIDVSNPYQAQLVEDVHEAAERHGYHLVLSTITRSYDERRAIETLLDSRCAALVLLGPQLPEDQLADLGRQLPVVVIGRPVSSAGVDVVRTADDEGLAQAIDYLADLGHRRIVYLDGGRGTVPSLRRRAYRGAMRRHQLAGHIHIVPCGDTEGAGAGATSALLATEPPPTAVLTFNDRSAMGLIDSLIRARIDIPRFISVIGYDDIPVARLAHIGLTTVSQNTPELAEHAIVTLVERLDNSRTVPYDIVVPPHLVIRGTSGPPRN